MKQSFAVFFNKKEKKAVEKAVEKEEEEIYFSES